MISNYSNFTSRNYCFISDDMQETIKKTELIFFGCGLGANIALSAARLGFENFYLCDHDKVGIENLNRQPFTVDDISKKKTLALKNHLKGVNPKVKIMMENRRIDLLLLKEASLSANFCINTIDYGHDYIEITDYLAFERGIPVILPINLGFGSLVLVFTKDSAKFGEILEGKAPNKENTLMSIVKNAGIQLPSYLNDHQVEIFEEIRKRQYDPQLITASNLTSSIVINIIISMLKGDKIKLAPQAIYLDVQELIK